jgi:hypothetical protein
MVKFEHLRKVFVSAPDNRGKIAASEHMVREADFRARLISQSVAT